MRTIKALGLCLVFASVSRLAVSSDLNPAMLQGHWQKEYFLQKDVRNQDPRWELSVNFSEDGKFIYHSKNTTEIFLTNAAAESHVTETTVRGLWTLGRGQLVLSFDRVLTDDERKQAITNLGYNPVQANAIIACSITDNTLTLKPIRGDREFVFKRADDVGLQPRLLELPALADVFTFGFAYVPQDITPYFTPESLQRIYPKLIPADVRIPVGGKRFTQSGVIVTHDKRTLFWSTVSDRYISVLFPTGETMFYAKTKSVEIR